MRKSIFTSTLPILLASLVVATPMRAASFDCARAASPIEKAICADPELGRLDSDVDQEYRRVLQAAGPGFEAKVRAVQRAWLRARVDPGALKALLQQRLENLRHAVIAAGPVTLLRLDGEHLPPYVLTALPGQTAYNRAADDIVADAQTDYTSAAQFAACNRLADRTDSETASPEVKAKLAECEELSQTGRDYEVTLLSADLISVEERLIVDGWRTAHPANSSQHFNFWLSRPGKVRVDEIFGGAKYRDVIRAAVRNQVEGSEGGKVVLEPQQWGLRREALIITAEGYDLGTGRGSFEITVPWGAFGPSLKRPFLDLLKRAPVVDAALLNPAHH